jgi:processive 1,2-diacylglycerol beta-glucosyltransferase
MESPTETKTRILVLTSSTGGGHDARAVAFSQWVNELYGDRVEVKIESLLENSSRIIAFGVNLYNWIQKNAPWLHHPYWCVVELFGFLNRKSVSLGKSYYRRLLESYRPHLVFSVHDCTNRGYFQEAREVLGANNVRCSVYCGEFSGGYGYSANWLEPSTDLYVSRTAEAQEFAIKQGGMAWDRCVVRGHLMRPLVYQQVVNEEERRRLRKEEFGLDPDRFTVFLATGGTGANNHLQLLPVLEEFANWLQVVVVCGKNETSYRDVTNWLSTRKHLISYVEGYSEQVHRLTQISDVIVTRGGTTTCAEALHFRCPIIFNGMGGVMPQERLTLKYFLQNRAAIKMVSSHDLRRTLDHWRRDPAHYYDMKERFCALRFEEDPSLLIRELVGLADEANQNLKATES